MSTLATSQSEALDVEDSESIIPVSGQAGPGRLSVGHSILLGSMEHRGSDEGSFTLGCHSCERWRNV